jgi:predicted TIM-barrel fold metal-dependent hydrolase
MSNYLVVSSDGHAGPPAAIYRDYLEEAFRPAFDDFQAQANGRVINQAFVEEWDEETGDHDLLSAYDPTTRDTILDSEGVAAEVLFPDADVLGTGRAAASPFGSGLASGAGADTERVLAGARAHNRWLADFVATNRHRRIGCAVVPVTEGVGPAVEQIHWAADHGLKGIMIPTRWFDHAAYHETSYDPIWAACAETGLVVHTHSGAGPSDYAMGPGFMAIYAAESWWWAARPMWVLILSGVFERHPTLKYSIAENGAWWVPDIVKRMDEKWDGGHTTRKFGQEAFRGGLSMRPSEYVDRNCFFAASTPSEDEIDRRHAIGLGNLMWGNDLPHPEGTYPHTRAWITKRFRNVPDDEARQILGGNAIEAYGLDRAALTEISDRIGMTPAEVHAPADEHEDAISLEVAHDH